MAFDRVHPDDLARVQTSVDIVNDAMAVDDPTTPRAIPELAAGQLRYGWDLEPDERFLYTPPGASEPVGVLDLALPMRDNRHLVWAELVVHPASRRQGHGSAMMGEVLRRAGEA